MHDSKPPSIGGEGASTTVEGCPATYTPVYTEPTTSDSWTEALPLPDASPTWDSCTTTFTRTWYASDACNNTSETVSQHFTVHDSTPPSIGGQGASTTVEGCPATYTPVYTEPTTSDSCNGATLHPSDSTTGDSCTTTFTRTWYASDACNNTSQTVSQHFTVHHRTPPGIGGQGASTTVEGRPATDTPVHTEPTTSASCNAATLHPSDSTTGDSCTTTFTRTWYASDACDNTSETVSQHFTVHDSTPPSIGGQGASTTVEGCPATYTPVYTEPTTSDSCNGATLHPSDSTTGDSCTTTFTRTTYASDACNNTSETVSQHFTVHDSTPPSIGGQGASTTVEGCPATYTPVYTEPTTSDSCNGATLHPSDSTTGDSCTTTFTRTWYASDACNNTSATVSQHFTVHDSTPPSIGGQGASTTVEGCPAT